MMPKMGLVLLLVRVVAIEEFTVCGGPAPAYGAAWLAPTEVAQRVRWPHKFTRLESASFQMFYTAKRKGGALQFREPRLFFTMHLSRWVLHVKTSYGKLGLGDSLFRAHALNRLEFAARRECDRTLVGGMPRKSNIVAVVPFHADDCRKSCEDPWRRDTGNSHSVADRAMKLATLAATLCSILAFARKVLVFVMPDQLRRLERAFLDETRSDREAFRSNHSSSGLLPRDLAHRVQFRTSTEPWCDKPRMLPFCALESLESLNPTEKNTPSFVYYSEADLIARWGSPAALDRALARMKADAARGNESYFPPIRTISDACVHPTNESSLHVENACDLGTARAVFPPEIAGCHASERATLLSRLHGRNASSFSSRGGRHSHFWWDSLPQAADLLLASS